MTRQSGSASRDKLAGGGEMGALIRAFDWSQTPLGPSERWSSSLRTMVEILLANRFPLLLWWGPQYVSIYNDPYRPVLGTKHPGALGQPVRECWSEIWHVLQPLIDTPFNGGPATWDDDLFLEINRHGFLEETHFTVAYSPVPDESVPSGIGGVLATVHEITRQVIQERRLAALRDLGARSTDAKTAEEAGAIAAEVFGRHPKDVPFALLYLIDAETRTARLAGAAGVEKGASISPSVVDLTVPDGSARTWPLATVIQTEAPRAVENLTSLFDAVPAGPWSDPPNRALMLPVPSNVQHRLAGLLVLGISARLALDDFYRGFAELAAAQVATAIANARAYEEERERAEALAELDRAKTAFFSNVSHEFRTPLTLSLGPVEDALADSDHLLPAPQRERLEIVHRNQLRLLKLVNSLLDFSRIEAGRIQAHYEPTDLAASTADLASVFRSALERAGLRLVVDCPPLPAPVYVDRGMWEKIVLNLLSNAFKHTFAGEIAVSQRWRDDHVELEIRDTGVGIPAAELPRIFERFHRVEGTRARTHEGTGIGLALVRELAQLHGGAVRVASVEGRGTTFTVSIPTGTAHLPSDRPGPTREQVSTALGAAPFVEEALRWLPSPSPSPPDAETRRHGDAVTAGGEGGGGRVLVADDNADLRAYVAGLLAARYDVEAVADGEAALAAVEARRPDLVLADVMMPNLDGFALLRALRADARTSSLPIILLSARAGEEARVEGLRAGADDYLVKPFGARELLARVEASINLARTRADAERDLRESMAREQSARAEAEAAVRARDDFLSIAAHELKTPVTGIKGSAQLLQRALDRGWLDEARLRRYAETIARGSERLAALTNDLLDVSRVQFGQLTLDRNRLDLADLIRDVVDRFRDGLDGHHVVDLRQLPAWCFVLADAARLEQVLVNLLDNAVKYSPDGGTVIVTVERVDAGLALKVEDSGIGLPADSLEAIFEPFGRAANATERHLPGMGLGLHICRTIVERHGGTLRAESPGLNQGTTMVVALPLAGDQAKEPEGV